MISSGGRGIIYRPLLVDLFGLPWRDVLDHAGAFCVALVYAYTIA
nr:MAG TPA: hypothetical protein [Caudoviricetes sp.]